MSPAFKGRGDRYDCVVAGIGTHEVVAGHITAGELLRLVEMLEVGVA